MPYIHKNARESARQNPETPGQLNYALTMCMLRSESGVLAGDIRDYITNYKPNELLSYNRANEIVGALTCCSLEWKRRAKSAPEYFPRFIVLINERDRYYAEIVAPYEDRKIAENGDVYE